MIFFCLSYETTYTVLTKITHEIKNHKMSTFTQAHTIKFNYCHALCAIQATTDAWIMMTSLYCILYIKIEY